MNGLGGPILYWKGTAFSYDSDRLTAILGDATDMDLNLAAHPLILLRELEPHDCVRFPVQSVLVHT